MSDTTAVRDGLREELRSWLQGHTYPSLIGLTPYDLENLLWRNPEAPGYDEFVAYEAAAAEARWICPQWPVEYGGRGLNSSEMAVLAEEFAAVDMPRFMRGMGERLAAPAILAHGTPEQKEYFLSRILAGEDRYAQGFSEPGAGSDLGAVATRGRVDGDELVIDGQKIWTSMGHLADMLFMLCRTDPEAPKHRGISYVLLPVRDNGVTVSPLVTLAGEDEFSQVFLDGARAPLRNVIGGLHQGWRTAMTTLDSERGAVAAVAHIGYEDEWHALMARARELGKDTDPYVRREMAWAYTQIGILKATGERVLAGLAAGGELPPASLTKLNWSEYHRRLGEIAMVVEGPASLVRPEGDDYALSAWQRVFLRSRAETIYAGSSEIQRKIIAERTLGLPKGAAHA